VHGTQKPVECMRRPILNNSAAGDTIYEPFCGSGSTIIAAETTGRVCLAMEVDPRYVDVAMRRWQAFTGRAAVMAGEERVFDDFAAARAVQAAA
jgi:DNA modification methylase